MKRQPTFAAIAITAELRPATGNMWQRIAKVVGETDHGGFSG
jgi:hypothetical protein